jgi:uncharacterized protein (TIGR02996 family)
MSDEAGLIQAIRDRPGDDGSRLVYADWLEERGDIRAEYLRLECQLSQIALRLAEIQAGLEPAWLADVRRPPTGAVGSVRLHTGRDVRVESMQQWFTYGGLLEGLPTDRLNREMIERLLSDERERDPWAGEPYLVPPVVRPIDWREERPYPFGTPEELPRVTCVARVRSHRPAREMNKDGSALTVIWFQDEFAFPIDPRVLEHLRGLDWDSRAFDFNW